MSDGHDFNSFPNIGLLPLQNEVVFVELCAGSGVLSATAKEYGYFVFPVDHHHNRHHHFTKIFQLDLTEDKAWIFLDWLRESATVVAWHFGLPCGSCSRAREIPLDDGTPGPQP